MKKIMNLLLVFALMITFLMPNVSAVTNNDNGKITIKEAICGKTYSVYQVLVLESYDPVSGGVIYAVNKTNPSTTPNWETFVNSAEIKDIYLKIENGHVKWVEDADKNEFVKKALKFAKDNNIQPTQTQTAPELQDTNVTTVEFTNLNLGYYLVDSSLGALLGLTTTNPVAEFTEKNSEPTVIKEVKENSKGDFTDEPDKENTASIGDIIEYQTTITVGLGAENYKLYDIISEGLTFNDDIVVTVDGVALVEDEDYEFIEDEDYTFVISFLKTPEVNKTILVNYTATLNENAVTGTNGNINETWLEYGHSHTTKHDKTTTKTYSFDLVKTDENGKILEDLDANDNSLNDAEFRLYDASGNEVFVVLKNGIYYVDSSATSGDVIKAGIVTIKGLDSNTYYLEETRNPDGYKKLSSRVKVEITNQNLDATFAYECATGTLNENQCVIDAETKVPATKKYTSGVVKVVNSKGSSLPTTGGMGTTLFITIGSLMVTLFGLLLVTKFRMSKMDI